MRSKRAVQAWIALAAVAVGAGVIAQTRTDTHRGKVEVLSTASDAATITGGANIGGQLTVTGQAVLGGTLSVGTAGSMQITGATAPQLIQYEADGGTDQKYWRWLQDGGDLYLYGMNDAFSSGTPLVTFARDAMTDFQALFSDGSATKPVLSFLGDQDTGIYRSGGDSIGIAAGGVNILNINGSAGTNAITMATRALGTGASPGSEIWLTRNTSGNGAPGTLRSADKTGTFWSIWPDSTGVLRISSTTPTEGSGDAIGTVVGTQTSTAASKHILGQVLDTDLAMRVLRRTPVFAFTYKNGAYNGETFYGITTDASPLFGMDGGKSFNPVTAFGVTTLAVQNVDGRVTVLESMVAELRAELQALKAGRR